MSELLKPQQPQAFIDLITGAGEERKESELKIEVETIYKQAKKIISTYGIQKRGFITYTAGPFATSRKTGESVGTEYKKHPLYQVTHPIKIIVNGNSQFLTLAKEKNEEEIKLRLSQTKKAAMDFNFGPMDDTDVLCTISPTANPFLSSERKMTGISPDEYRPVLPETLNFIEESLTSQKRGPAKK